MTLIPRLLVRRRELDLAVDTAGANKCGIEGVDTIGGHDDLDVSAGIEAVELVEELEHRALDLRVAATAPRRS